MDFTRFYSLSEESYKIAKLIIPSVFEIIGIPDSVLDLGGGYGQWCKAFKEFGIKKVLCIDHPSIETKNLLIEEKEFYPCDINKELPKKEIYDLSICLEFCEHIKQNRSHDVIEFLTNTSDKILFSAAIPHQGGFNHINEQRAIFWQKLFYKHGYLMFDLIRPQIINKKEIPYYYRQNMFLYVNKNSKNDVFVKNDYNIDPEEFEIVSTYILNKKPGFSDVLFKELPLSFIRAIRNRFF